VGYNRDSAVSYARLHWMEPCDDGVIALASNGPLVVEQERKRLGATGTDWLPRFQKVARGAEFVERFVFFNPSTKEIRKSHEWEGLADCAHFLSKCVSAGGVPLSTDWVPTIVDTLRRLDSTKTLGAKVVDYRAKEIIDVGVVRKGDVICYFDGLGKELGGGYVHSGIFVDGSNISCHTRARFGEDWNIHPGRYRHTIIHFADDDREAIESFASRVAGLWEVVWRGETYYYTFDRKGRVSYSSSRSGAPEGRGYWFPYPAAGSGGLVICWTNSGSVERYVLDGSKGATGRWNQLTENERLDARQL